MRLMADDSSGAAPRADELEEEELARLEEEELAKLEEEELAKLEEEELARLEEEELAKLEEEERAAIEADSSVGELGGTCEADRLIRLRTAGDGPGAGSRWSTGQELAQLEAEELAKLAAEDELEAELALLEADALPAMTPRELKQTVKELLREDKVRCTGGC